MVGSLTRSVCPAWADNAFIVSSRQSLTNEGGYSGSRGYNPAKSCCSLGLPVPTGEAGGRSQPGTAGTGNKGRVLYDYVSRQLEKLELLGCSAPRIPGGPRGRRIRRIASAASLCRAFGFETRTIGAWAWRPARSVGHLGTVHQDSRGGTAGGRFSRKGARPFWVRRRDRKADPLRAPRSGWSQPAFVENPVAPTICRRPRSLRVGSVRRVNAGPAASVRETVGCTQCHL